MDEAGRIKQMVKGRIELIGLVTWGSNYTFLSEMISATADGEEDRFEVIYKPEKGERPLWDFPAGTLYKRERSAFLLDRLLGFDLVPPTVVGEGPHGVGSVQLFIAHDPEAHYFTFHKQYGEIMAQVSVLDFIINNADRKGGHLLCDEGGRVWAIDNGLSFHEAYKMRTVVWDFSGEAISAEIITAITTLRQKLIDADNVGSAELQTLLSPAEFDAILTRIDTLLTTRTFPEPQSDRPYPWPPV